MTRESAGYPSPPERLARLADVRRGVRKGRKIRRILENEIGPAPWPGLRGLDLGCGPGVITAYLARLAAGFVGLDVDRAALEAARRRFRRPNLEFVRHESAKLPFADGAFDLVIVNHVYEHVRDVKTFFAEIRRVLKPAGVVYLAAAGKYQILEPHYHLPLLSWLPRRAANAYLRVSGRADEYDANLLSYRKLFKFLEPFDVREYTAAVIANPRRFAADDVIPRWRPVRRVLGAVARRAPAAAPTRIFVLRIRDNGTP